MEAIIKQALKDLVLMVKEFEETLKKEYDIKGHPFDFIGGKPIPNIGNANNYSYHFHGGGCKVEFENKKVNYGIVPITKNNRVKITPRELLLFIKSYINEPYIENIDSKNMHLIFRELEKNGIVKLVEDSRANYEIIEY